MTSDNSDQADGANDEIFEYRMFSGGSGALTVNGQNADYTTTKFFLDEGESDPDGFYDEMQPETPFRIPEREWIEEGGGVLAADSPKMLFDMLDTFEKANLRKVIDKGFDTPLLHTVQSTGYRMADLARPVQKTAAAQPAASADPIAA